MKRWIVKQFIQVSEVTGRPVPTWVRRLLPEKTFAAMQESEQDLTRALRAPRRARSPMPDDLKSRMDAALRRSTSVSRRRERSFPSLSWALAAAALLVLGSLLFFRPSSAPDLPKGDVPLLVESPPPPAPDPLDPAPPESPALPVEALSSDLLLRPLASEQERLAADVTNALQYVADSFLPSAYAAAVYDSLQSVEQRLIKAI